MNIAKKVWVLEKPVLSQTHGYGQWDSPGWAYCPLPGVNSEANTVHRNAHNRGERAASQARILSNRLNEYNGGKATHSP